MKNVQQDPIDELFRSELSSYTIPITSAVAAATIATIAVKKGLFANLSIIKLHVAYTVAIATTTVGGISYGAVKAYQHFTKPTHIEQTVQPQNNLLEPQGNQVFVIDSLQNNEQDMQNTTLDTTNTNTMGIEQKHITTTNKPQKTTLLKTESHTQTNVIEVNTSHTPQPITDTTTPQVKVVKKVVYVQQPKVVVQDTVIKVVKRKKK